VFFRGACNCFMRRVFLLLCALVSVSVFAQVPMESTVTLTVSYAPRSSAKPATKTLSSAGLIQEMGLSGGSIVCVGDASNPLGGWTFKHVLPSKVKGGSAVETDLSDMIGVEVLGYSDVGTYKAASSVAPKFQTTLGRVTRNATVKLRVEPSEGMSFEFLGGVTIGYSVIQRAGTTEAAWVPGAMSFTGAGTSVTSEEEEDVCWATVKATMGAFKVVASSSTGGTAASGMVLVKGGTLPEGSQLAGQVVEDFSIGRTEVTWGKWKAVRDWAVMKGYGLAVGGGTYPENGADNLPVVNVNWYDVVKWCNALSEREGKTPVYEANGAVYRSGEFGAYGSSSVTMKSGANGYRLPLEKEWEWAARGGVSSKGYTYSGSNVVGEVAWFNENSPQATKAAGGRKANELGLSDMSGNVWEWLWDVYDGTSYRRIRGGSWFDYAYNAEVSIRDGSGIPDDRSNGGGFRVAFSGIFTAHPSGGVLVNGSASLSVSATGLGLSYQWRKDGVNIPGATSASYTATEAGTYSVVVTNLAGSVTSRDAVISVPLPAITAHPSGGVLVNGSASLSVSATGPGLSYQWRKDGVNIPGATSASYTATAAGIYSVVVTNIAGSVTSSSAVISVMVLVAGGTLPQVSELAGQVVEDFSIGRTEVTWGEWKAVRDWAVVNGYADLAGVGGTYPENGGDNLPVVYVSWYEVVKWCNARSEKDGKTAVYQANGEVYRTGEFGEKGSSAVTMKSGANGYRLPLEREWEWAARGGVSSKGYTYSGSNVVGEVAWTDEDSGWGARAVGGKKANELGLYDMSGNVWEWCWDLGNWTSSRRIRGGSWDSSAGYAEVSNRGISSYPDYRFYNFGFRVAFSSGQ
jgi:sulfatase modifying factor 1